MGTPMSQEDNFSYLLGSLVLVLLSAALVEQFFDSGQMIVVATTVMSLSISVIGLGANKKWIRSTFGLMITTLLFASIGSVFELLNLDILGLLTILSFLIAATWRAAKQVIFSGKISSNQIIGSICIFLLLGLIWAFIYLLIIEIFGVAFNGVEVKKWTDNLSLVIYYSYITLSTVGYGEITPAIPIARFFAFFEAIFGQFYMAIIVASLVGAKMSQNEKE
ncbi:ion channel [Shewanella sp. 1_MG-2023]|uniref:Ion channel n=1 Tax=Shewanella electrodiphila TaxID=934143 RepID=A0ABT0KQZ9_9GAMM|nr:MULTISPECIES: ion channel [Shewanella]MCC4834853.1 two pore domain potassium channel family protein [Shewanella sp. 10N.7]MCL1046281.1 ion channel [Shewanella electrodiphila]MDO6613298.1 ion channel [Shewanella sp. 7_MG-2023]MDO6773234.1 ion channel [Shewanella sp. 2_MG-2023]MDO6796202.1 ion channel [Shewanella sp. 1_MG-2023]